jgi:hypothetical protein
MLSLVYCSSATNAFSEADLVALLSQSRENNARLDITGMLLYKDGNFIQVLEGPDDAVRQLFNTISADYRHRGVIKLLERPVEERHFADWSMAFRNLTDPGLRDIPGYSEFLNEPLDSPAFRTDPNHARRLLELFRTKISR